MEKSEPQLLAKLQLSASKCATISQLLMNSEDLRCQLLVSITNAQN